MHRLAAAFIALGALSAGAALAEERTAVMAVEMTCPMSDPPVLKRTMTMIDGVIDAEVSYEARTVTVTYDDTAVDEQTLLDAFLDLRIDAEIQETGS